MLKGILTIESKAQQCRHCLDCCTNNRSIVADRPIRDRVHCGDQRPQTDLEDLEDDLLAAGKATDE